MTTPASRSGLLETEAPDEETLSRRSWFRLSLPEWMVFLAFAALGYFLFLVLDLHHSIYRPVWTGTDGPYLGDQMQYLGWIRDAAHGVLIGDPFRLGGSRHLFVHPGLAISGVLNRLGLTAAASYDVWKPVAIVGLFLAVRAYVRRMIDGRWARLAALVLALFAFAPIQELFFQWQIGTPAVALHWHAMSLDMWPALYLWGYPFTALAVALIPATLLLYEHARRRVRWGSIGWAAVLSGLLCSWLQPWQGATLAGILIGTELVLWRRTRQMPPRLAIAATGATGLPLVYYAALSHLDRGWRVAGQANRFPAWPVWSVVVFFLPMVLLAAFELVRPAPTFQDVAVRMWPVSAITLYWVITYTPFGTFPLHTYQGLSIPIAVLVVRSLTSLHAGWARKAGAVALAAVLVVAVGIDVERELKLEAHAAVHSNTPYFLTSGEQEAVDYLSRQPRSQGVLTRVFLGQTIPALTGLPTWVGIASWTPDYERRVKLADGLFLGKMSPSVARRFVRKTGARWLLSDCRGGAVDLGHLLGSMVKETKTFSCATVYQLR